MLSQTSSSWLTAHRSRVYRSTPLHHARGASVTSATQPEEMPPLQPSLKIFLVILCLASWTILVRITRLRAFSLIVIGPLPSDSAPIKSSIPRKGEHKSRSSMTTDFCLVLQHSSRPGCRVRSSIGFPSLKYSPMAAMVADIAGSSKVAMPKYRRT